MTRITYLRAHEGVAHLSVAIDLLSRRAVGWAVQPSQTSELAVQAILMVIWRREPRPGLLIYSDQIVQLKSRERAAFLHEHHLEHSISRRGKCHDNTVTFSFFQLLKRERVRLRKYRTRDQARQEVFEYIEIFYNPKPKHTSDGIRSPADYASGQHKLEKAGV